MQRINVSSGGPFGDVYGYGRAVRVGDCDAYEQAKSSLAIIEDALREVGSSTAAVVRTVTYITDMADIELVARAHSETFGEVKPAATLVGASALVDPRMKVEIEAYAIEPAG